MARILKQGEFKNYAVTSLERAYSPIQEGFTYEKKLVTVFISHRHDDLEDLKGVLGFLEKNYNVKVYIDSRDSSMPKMTSSKTAEKLKSRIEICNKFILLATNSAIDSKWCNWELGYGDANKFQENIALFPLYPEGYMAGKFKGAEYLELYPYIAYSDGTERYTDGSQVPAGYYVVTKQESGMSYTSLKKWFEN